MNDGAPHQPPVPPPAADGAPQLPPPPNRGNRGNRGNNDNNNDNNMLLLRLIETLQARTEAAEAERAREKEATNALNAALALERARDHELARKAQEVQNEQMRKLLELHTSSQDRNTKQIERTIARDTHRWAVVAENVARWADTQRAEFREDNGKARVRLVTRFKALVKDNRLPLSKCLMLHYCLDLDPERRYLFAQALLNDNDEGVITKHNWLYANADSAAWRDENGPKLLKLDVPLFPAYMGDENERLLAAASQLVGAGELKGAGHAGESEAVQLFAKEVPMASSARMSQTQPQRVKLVQPNSLSALVGAGYRAQVESDGMVDLTVVEEAVGKLFNIANDSQQEVARLQQRINALESRREYRSDSRSDSRSRAPSRGRSPNVQSRGPTDRACFKCGSKAHLQADCPDRQSRRRSPSTSSRQMYGSGEVQVNGSVA
eukprot:GILI01005270.1.p1 GENE.GILI01005270.1~~GILI01005270.1.p1  ORF type:complete len:474 (-),score=66.19 GILI01005270.1:17-1327(-)